MTGCAREDVPAFAVLFGVAVADAFLDAWLAETGAPTHDPYWDIVCLLDAGPGEGGDDPARLGKQKDAAGVEEHGARCHTASAQ